MSETQNINDSYFDGYYKDIWKSVIPDEFTVKEVDFMIPYFNLKPGSRVLDLMCGYGRHAIGLAKKGIEVVAVDNLGDYIDEIKETAAKDKLPLQAIRADVISFSSDKSFDLVICMGNSLNFFNATDVLRLLKMIAFSLKSGGKLLINTWSLAEIVIKHFKEKASSNIGDMKFLTNSKFLFRPTRIETESVFIATNGKTETKKAIDYIFSINEIENLLTNANLVLTEVYSIPGRKNFSIGEPRAYIVAEKKK